MGSPITTESRRDRLRELVQARGFAALGELAGTLEVSESTIRRDLETLEKTVTPAAPMAVFSGLVSQRRCGSLSHVAIHSGRRKQRLVKSAAELIEDHDTILLDGGSTTYELARQLVGRPLQVVTNILPIAHLMSSSEQTDLVMIGGCVQGQRGVAIGPMTDAMLATINVSKAFLSVAGITDPRLLQQRHDAGRKRESDVGRSGSRDCSG